MPLRARAKRVAKQSPPGEEALSQTKLLFNARRLLRRGAHASSSGFALRSPCGDFAARGATPRNDILILFFLVLTACTPSTPAATPQVVTVYSSFAAQPWLNPLYACAGSFAVISRVDDPASADIILRVGEPQFLASPAFQIDTEEILIATHRQSPVQNLTLAEARALFAGQGDPSVQVWVYASDEDLQVAFDRLVMAGRSVTPSARLAVHPQQMSDTLVKEPDTVGILPRHWKAGDSREVFNAGIVPVLAITQAEPAGEIKNLIGCLQQQ